MSKQRYKVDILENTYKVFRTYLEDFDEVLTSDDMKKFPKQIDVLNKLGHVSNWTAKDFGKNLLMWLDIVYEGNYYGTRFDKFGVLSFALACSHLSVAQQFDIIINFIKYNLSVTSEQVLDIVALKGHQFKTLTFEEALNILNSGLAFNTTGFSLLANGEQEKLQELQEYLGYSSHEDKTNYVYYESLKEHYFDNNGKMTRSDVEAMLDALKGLGILKKLVNNIKDFLMDRLYEYKELMKLVGRKKDAETISCPKMKPKYKAIEESQPKYLKSEKHYLTDAEYNKVKKQLMEYVDLYNMVPKVELTLNALLRCIDMLVILDYKDADIIAFVNRELPKCDNTNIHYNREDFEELDGLSLYEKYKNLINFYKDNPNASLFINNLLMYVSELETLDDNELVELYKEEIKGILKEVLAVLPNDCRYEIEEVKRNLVSVGEKYYG